MVTLSQTLPYVQHVFSEYVPPDVVEQWKKTTGIGVSTDFMRPARPGAVFPDGYEAVLRLLTHGRYTITSPTVLSPHTWMLGAPGIPHYQTMEDMLYIPRAEQFESDLTAWHTLFHEAAHRLHLRPIFEQMYITMGPNGMPASYVKEPVADAAAYAAQRAVGMDANLQHTVLYVNDWLRARLPWEPQPDTTTDLVQPAAKVAAMIANVYNGVMNGVRTYV